MKEENLPLKEKEALILSYYRMVVRYLSVFGIEESLMEDAVQETYMEAFASLPIHKNVHIRRFKTMLSRKALNIGS